MSVNHVWEFAKPVLCNLGMYTLAQESGFTPPDLKATMVYSLALQIFNIGVVTLVDPCLFQYKPVTVGIHLSGICVAMLSTKYFHGKKDVDKLGFLHFVGILVFAP